MSERILSGVLCSLCNDVYVYLGSGPCRKMLIRMRFLFSLILGICWFRVKERGSKQTWEKWYLKCYVGNRVTAVPFSW